MKNITYLFISLFSILSFSKVWKINKDHSEIKFSIPYLTLSEVSGRFSHFGGKAKFNQNLPESISLWIASDSIYTGRSLRDGHLKSNEFLKVKKYPFIYFQSKEIVALQDNKFEVLGEMKIKNKTKDVVFKMSISKEVEDTWGKLSRFVSFSSLINRKKFDLTWDKTLKENKFLVGEDVKVFGTIQIQPSGVVTNSSNHLIPDTEYQRKREAFNRGELKAGDDIYLPSEKPILGLKKSEHLSAHEKKVSNNKRVSSNKYENILWWGSYFFIILLGVFSIPFSRLFLLNKYFKNSDDLFYLNISTFLLIIIFVLSLNVLFFLR